MVDFNKLIEKKEPQQILDPILIFDDLDKESGKEFLRPPQEAVLREWNEKWRNKRDTIVKLHTGQGKTLIGLLMLQSYMNEGNGPVLYLCPNSYLVNQTIEQARAFNIKTVQFSKVNRKPPEDFLNSKAILVTTCKKLFNGKSVFGVVGSGREPINIGGLVVDDAHKCLDIIRESFSIIINKIDKNQRLNPVYTSIWGLFKECLSRQAPGTCSDIVSGEENCLMAVPFWAWHDKQEEVLNILQEYKEIYNEVLFVWDLLKNRIANSMCIFSGNRLEITPRLIPIDLLPSFSAAKRRVFLSATLTEDSFLVRDLGIEAQSVSSPLSSGDVKYCGERLIVIPSLVDPNLSRKELITWISNIAKFNRDFGVVTITPSFALANYWKSYGAVVTNVKTLEQNINDLKDLIKNKKAKNVMVLVNEYDGVDLPDAVCRVLTLDCLPQYSSLIDRFVQEMRPTSGIIRRQLAQRVEQGMGRAIRGSSDWCIVIILGNNLTDFLSESSKRKFLSKEARLQINIGEELANEMKQEGTKLNALKTLLNQVLKREPSWKEYYKERMSSLEPEEANTNYLERVNLERKAEIQYLRGDFKRAINNLEKLIQMSDQIDKGWYLQLMATYLFPLNATKSMDLQLRAHNENNRLFRPETGIMYSRLASTGSNRASLILDWIKEHESHNSLLINLTGILDKVVFGTSSELFEQGMDELGKVLGFLTQRPEKETGGGPDNLWNIEGKTYWIIECKNMISSTRKSISKKEIGQLSNAMGWFQDAYDASKGLYILVHPADKLANNAFPPEQIWLIDEEKLDDLKRTVKQFYVSMQDLSFANDLSVEIIQTKLEEFKLDTDSLVRYYLKRVKKQ